MRPSHCLKKNAILLALAAVPLYAASPLDLAPPGPHFKLTSQAHADADTFESRQPIVGTTYFYWYDVYSGDHVYDPDGTDALTTHPPKQMMADLSYRSPNWHYSQLRDVGQARIDFIMPVFWGVPGQYDGWSFIGLPPLVQGHDRMLAEHRADPSIPAPPMIGLFYDTSTLRVNDAAPDGSGVHIDLTTSRGRDWFYVTIRDFFSMIPPAKWARIDGKPIVFLYAASFAEAVDGNLFDDTRRRFEADFGTGLFLVRHADWPGRADAWYRWGGAFGLTVGDQVAGIGPGYDHSAVPRRKPLVVPRRAGRFYREQWEKLLGMQPLRRPWIVHLETWNEWHEGTDIARSDAWGTRYIALTSRYGELFRAGSRMRPTGEYVNSSRVRWSGGIIAGLTLLPSGGDGCWERRVIDGAPAVVTIPSDRDLPARYVYFDIDNSYAFDEMDRAAEVTVVFRDDGCERLRVEYDNGDPDAGPMGGAFRPSRWVELTDAGTWRIVKLQLPDVRFSNRTNGADLRLRPAGGDRRLTVREVIVRKLPGTTTRPADGAATAE